MPSYDPLPHPRWSPFDAIALGNSMPVGSYPGFLPILDALSLIHRRGVVHADISPCTLALDEATAELRLGYVSYLPGGGRCAHVLMHPRFAAIEQFTGQGVGRWSDVYGMSATIFACLTGTPAPCALNRLPS